MYIIINPSRSSQSDPLRLALLRLGCFHVLSLSLASLLYVSPFVGLIVCWLDGLFGLIVCSPDRLLD